MKELINNYDKEKTSRTEKENLLIERGINRAGVNYAKILDEYYSNVYDDNTDLIGRTQFSHLFRHFADCLVERGWTIEDLNKEILNCSEIKKKQLNESKL